MSGDTSRCYNRGGWRCFWLRLHRTGPHNKAFFGLNIKSVEVGVLCLQGQTFTQHQGDHCHPGTLPSSMLHQLLPRSRVYRSSPANCVSTQTQVFTTGNCCVLLWRRKRESTGAEWHAEEGCSGDRQQEAHWCCLASCGCKQAGSSAGREALDSSSHPC